VPVPRLLDPVIIPVHILIHKLAPLVGSPGDKVVQSSIVAGKVGVSLDAMRVVVGPSSGSGVSPAWRSKSPSASHSNHDDGSYHGGQDLVDLDAEAPLPMIDW